MTREEAEQALAAWASIERDELVRAAHTAGVSKNRIHTITKISRPTIDRILEAAMVQTQIDRLTDYLTRYTASWPRHDILPRYHPVPAAVADTRSADEIAHELLADVEFRALKLGTFLNTPDGQVVAAAVEAITPPPYRKDVTLLIDALQLAARQQHQEAREAVAKAVLVALGVAAVAALVTTNGDS